MLFESDEVHACIVTCGGLCPGLNTVIREIVCGLYRMYGVHRVVGIEVIIFPFHYPSSPLKLSLIRAITSPIGRVQRFLCKEYNSVNTQVGEQHP